MMRLLFIPCGLGLFLSGCAILHHSQVGEIDNRHSGPKFEILMSETGVNLKEIRQMLQGLTASKAARSDMGQVQETLGMFQTGPKTGNIVFNDKYADLVLDAIIEKCPKGKVTGLNSIRESNKYPGVSGEIIKITGYCNKR